MNTVDEIAVCANFFFWWGQGMRRAEREGQQWRTPGEKNNEEWYNRLLVYLLRELQGVNGGDLRILNLLLEMRVPTPNESPLCHNTDKTVLVFNFWFISRSSFSSVPQSFFFHISYALQMQPFYFFLFFFFPLIWSNPTFPSLCPTEHEESQFLYFCHIW